MPIGLKKKWIVSGLICLLLTSSIILPVFVYNVTRQSYFDVGFNHGTIAANEKTRRRIIDAVDTVQNCYDWEGLQIFYEVISVKASSLYLMNKDDSTVEFCEYQES